MVQDRDLFLPGTGLGLYLPETGFSGKAPLRNDKSISFIVTQYYTTPD
jgi:hypothetical protein